MQISDKEKGLTDTMSLFIGQISTWTYTNSNQLIPFSVEIESGTKCLVAMCIIHMYHLYDVRNIL